MEKAISTVREIAPVEAKDRLAGLEPGVLFETAPRDREHRLIR
jgi:hypothetical protein